MSGLPAVIQDSIKHHMGAGCYIREAVIPKDHYVAKHIHTYDHLSILGSGSVVVFAGGVKTNYTAPACIKITAGVPHEVVALEDSVWFCVHGTTDEIDDLESVVIKGVE